MRSRSEEWKDVQPIEIDEGSDPVVFIKFTEEFKDLMSLFRAVAASGELSPRVLSLTEEIINISPAHYTVWYHRQLVSQALGRSWREELQWCSTLADDNPKNYQIWQHRRWCLNCGITSGEFVALDAQCELDFLSDFLTNPDQGDHKNYHAWSNRQWLLRSCNSKFDLPFSIDVGFCMKMISLDVFNNSAWNHWHFCIKGGPSGSFKELPTAAILYACDVLRKHADNESPWSFIRGCFPEGIPFASFQPLVDAISFILAKEPRCRFALEMHAIIAAQSGDHSAAASQYCALSEVDETRKSYWLSIAQQLSSV
jgi:protein farnesyltransferase/geranylgeranyltransferase type-1 subunit alpha